MSKFENIGNIKDIIAENSEISINNDINIYSEDRKSIKFEDKLVKTQSVNEYEKNNVKISLAIGIMGLIVAIIDFMTASIQADKLMVKWDLFMVIGILTCCFGVYYYCKHILWFRVMKTINIGTDLHLELKDDVVSSFIKDSECCLCGSRVRLKKAFYWIDKEKRQYDVIGVCEKSNLRTKHYYEYDDITSKGTILSKEKASIYQFD